MFLARMITYLCSISRGRSYYGKYAKMYSQNLLKIPSFKLISDLTHGKILDIGCGIGYLSKLFNDYVGIDTSKEALLIARRHTDGDYVVASATNLPFRPNSFDACISYDLIEHITKVDNVIGEMRQTSSKVIISCVDFSSYYRFFTYDETHQKLLMPNELKILLAKYFPHVHLSKTSGIFSIPAPLNLFLSKHFPNQIILEGFS